MSDINFVSDGTLERILAPRPREQVLGDVLREGFKQKLKHIANDTEQATDYCRDLIRSGANVTEELKELSAIGASLSLVAALLGREARGSE